MNAQAAGQPPAGAAAAVTKPHLTEQTEQTEQAWCLTVLTNSVITWTTEYYAKAVTELRAQGRDISDDLL